ncbi:hypothetical protein GCM10010129_82690 [Streptomyces fumigatiscleroticus]|nr:hypothetical protein GCM10010129_82690 [Streptomyces fumigatiscleroticus]
MTLDSHHVNSYVEPFRGGTSTMQAAPVRATAIPSFTDALRAVESLLMSGGQRTARRNAWTSVLEDRRRAKDRVEAQRVLEQTLAPRP